MHIRQFFLLLLLFIASCKSGEKKEIIPDDRSGIEMMIAKYNEAFIRYDWEATLDIIHPDVFKTISREDFKKTLENAFSGDGYVIQFERISIDSVSPVIIDKGIKYSLVMMHNTSFMKLTGLTDSTITANKETLSNACEGMKQQFGQNFISCEVQNTGIRFSVKDRCYAIFIPAQKKWYFLSKDVQSEFITDKIVPANVREKLGY
jgi:hypothetical protein